jgi:hypothetical protein
MFTVSGVIPFFWTTFFTSNFTISYLLSRKQEFSSFEISDFLEACIIFPKKCPLKHSEEAQASSYLILLGLFITNKLITSHHFLWHFEGQVKISAVS